jgi:hypothetical protein
LEVTAATVAVNVALLSPAVMLTLPGTVIFVLVLESATLAVPEAAAVKVTVQVEVPGALTVAGEQVKLLSCAAAAMLMVACWLWPLKFAVTVAF